jgi:hypothetical protein
MTVFRQYDKGNKGHLTPKEVRTLSVVVATHWLTNDLATCWQFKKMVNDMRSSGISVDVLTTQHKKGCCGYLIKLPGEPLFEYIQHNHTVFTVLYG